MANGSTPCILKFGCSVFSPDCSDLRLAVSGYAQLTFPARIRHLITDENVEQLVTSGQVWVSAAPEVPFHLRLQVLPDVLDAPDVAFALIENLLQTWKFWSNVGLVAVSQESNRSIDHLHKNILLMETCFRGQLGEMLARAPTRIPNAVRIFEDCPSPTDFPTAILSSVHISIEIHQKRTLLPVSPQLSATAEITICPMIDCDLLHGDCSGETNESRYAIDSMVLDEDFHERSLASDLFDGEDELSLAFSSQSPLSSTTVVESAKHHGQIVELVKISVQNVVCGTVTENVEVLKDGDSSSALMDIAPAVFDSTYRNILHRRAKLVPLVAKTVVTFLEKTKNPILQSKLSKLGQIYGSEQYGLRVGSRFADATSIVKSRLWTLGQKRTPTMRRWEAQCLYDVDDVHQDADLAMDDDPLLLSHIDAINVSDTQNHELVFDRQPSSDDEQDVCWEDDEFDDLDEGDYDLAFHDMLNTTGDDHPSVGHSMDHEDVLMHNQAASEIENLLIVDRECESTWTGKFSWDTHELPPSLSCSIDPGNNDEMLISDPAENTCSSQTSRLIDLTCVEETSFSFGEAHDNVSWELM